MAKATRLRVVPTPSEGLAGLVDDRLAEMRARGLSRRTVALQRDVLVRMFLPWAAERGVTVPGQFTQGLLEEWSRYLLEDHRTPKDKPLSRASVRTYLRTMKGFTTWAQTRGNLGAVKVPMPAEGKKTLSVLTSREMRDMEDAATSERDKLIIRLLSDLGLRLGELLALRPDDLIKQTTNGRPARYINVKGKGSRERVIPLDPRLFDRLDRFARRPQARGALSGLIFTTERKHKDHYGALAPRTVQQMIANTAKDAGITKRVHPHLFRHSNITEQLNSGVPVEHIRRNVGHADLSMITKVYSDVQPNDRYESMLAMIRKREDEEKRH